MKLSFCVISFVAIISPALLTATAQCSNTFTVETATQLQLNLFRSLITVDRASYERLTTQDFVIYEMGTVRNREEEFGFVEKIIHSGSYAHWSVTEPHLDADCKVAVLHYRNVGDLKVGNGPVIPMQWLENAVFRQENGVWKVAFESSMRATALVGKADVSAR